MHIIWGEAAGSCTYKQLNQNKLINYRTSEKGKRNTILSYAQGWDFDIFLNVSWKMEARKGHWVGLSVSVWWHSGDQQHLGNRAELDYKCASSELLMAWDVKRMQYNMRLKWLSWVKYCLRDTPATSKYHSKKNLITNSSTSSTLLMQGFIIPAYAF